MKLGSLMAFAVAALMTVSEAAATDYNNTAAYRHYLTANELVLSGKLNEAAAQYQAALSLEPRCTDCIGKLGNCYFMRGQYRDARTCYLTYLSRATDPKEIALYRKKLALCDQEETSARTNGAFNADYLADVQANHLYYRWLPGAMPLRVYMEPAAPSAVKDFHFGYERLFFDAAAEWTRVLGNRVSFVRVSDPRKADIVCRWVEQLPDVGKRGDTTIDWGTDANGRGVILRADIAIAVKPFDGMKLPSEVIKTACLHELGHALGLEGHSANRNDVMYSCVNMFATAKLSPRDVATITRLYSN